MSDKSKHEFYLAAFSIILFNVLWNFRDIFSLLKALVHVCMPVLRGCLLAFVINVPMVKIERILVRLFCRAGNRKPESDFHLPSLVLTLILAAAVIAVFGTMIIPPVVASVSGATKLIDAKIPVLAEKAEQLGVNAESVDRVLSSARKFFPGMLLKRGSTVSSPQLRPAF